MPDGYAKEWWIVKVFGKQQYLLASLVALLVFLPLLSSPETSRFWVICLLTLIMVTGPLSIASRPFDFFLAVGLGILMATTSWLGAYVEHPLIRIVDNTSTVIFFFMLSGLIFRHYLFTSNEVTGETLVAAINAYLCIAIMYTFAYFYLMEYDPNSFAGNFMDDPEFSAFVYLSFITMTTLGYGDITPQTEAAAIMTYSQAVVGQLFMALTVARIVGITVARETAK